MDASSCIPEAGFLVLLQQAQYSKAVFPVKADVPPSFSLALFARKSQICSFSHITYCCHIPHMALVGHCRVSR